MRIAFYHAATWAWTTEDLQWHGVGGTETGMANMARALARRGHEVTVFNRTPQPGEHRGVRYRNVADLDPESTWEVFVCMSSLPWLERVKADTKIHWSPELWTDILPVVDAVFSIGPYHTRLLVEAYGLPPERLYTTVLPIEPEEYEQLPPKTANRLIFCSVPDRGLPNMAEVYRLVRHMVPTASLVVTGDYTLWGQVDGGKDAFRHLFDGLPGVELCGRVPRPRLVELQKTSALHVYPCCALELLCLASVECQAAGTPTVATAVGALTSTVEDGVTGCLVAPDVPPPGPGRPFIDLGPAVLRGVAERVAQLLTDAGRREEMARHARERAMRLFSADVVADRWLERFEELAGRSN